MRQFWIQFKYERLSDFCYKCKALDHVTGRCPFQNPATVTSINGIVSKLYGPLVESRACRQYVIRQPGYGGRSERSSDLEKKDGGGTRLVN